MELNFVDGFPTAVTGRGSQLSVNLFEQEPRPELPKIPSNLKHVPGMTFGSIS